MFSGYFNNDAQVADKVNLLAAPILFTPVNRINSPSAVCFLVRWGPHTAVPEDVIWSQTACVSIQRPCDRGCLCCG